MILYVYECSDDSFVATSETDLKKLETIAPNAKLIKEINGDDWNDCMFKYHEFMGWEKYQPF